MHGCGLLLGRRVAVAIDVACAVVAGTDGVAELTAGVHQHWNLEDVLVVGYIKFAGVDKLPVVLERWVELVWAILDDVGKLHECLLVELEVVLIALSRIGGVGVACCLIASLRGLTDVPAATEQSNLCVKCLGIAACSVLGGVAVASSPGEEIGCFSKVVEQVVEDLVTVGLGQCVGDVVAGGRLHLHWDVAKEADEIEVKHGTQGERFAEVLAHSGTLLLASVGVEVALADAVDGEVTVLDDAVHSGPECGDLRPAACGDVDVVHVTALAGSSGRGSSAAIDKLDVGVGGPYDGDVLRIGSILGEAAINLIDYVACIVGGIVNSLGVLLGGRVLIEEVIATGHRYHAKHNGGNSKNLFHCLIH